MVLDELAHVHEKVEAGISRGINAVDQEVDKLENEVAGIKTMFIKMQEMMVADLQRKNHQINRLEQLVEAQGEMIQALRQGLDEQQVIMLTM